jgi:glutamate racemase
MAITSTKARCIGVFDSGIGGLTVARELISRFPKTDLVYLGDTARLPYGAKSPETVTRYAIRCVQFLINAGVDQIVVACNTASAHAIPRLHAKFKTIPILGVVAPGASAAVRATRSGTIGVIGTEGTVASESYPEAIAKIAPNATVVSLAAPLLVPLAEVGWLDHAVTRLTVRTYLQPLLESTPEMDTLVLGCTHYPALKATIADVCKNLGRPMTLVDSAEAVTTTLAPNLTPGSSLRRICVTDLPGRFHQVAATFFGERISVVEHVDIT